MKTTKLLPVICILSLLLFGCERPEKTVDQLRKEITEFRESPDDQKLAAIEANLAKLDGQILKLRNHGSTEKANMLQEQRDSLAADFGAAKVYRTLQDAKSALKGIQDVIKKGEPGKEQEEQQQQPEGQPAATPHETIPKVDESPAAGTESPAGESPAAGTESPASESPAAGTSMESPSEQIQGTQPQGSPEASAQPTASEMQPPPQ